MIQRKAPQAHRTKSTYKDSKKCISLHARVREKLTLSLVTLPISKIPPPADLRVGSEVFLNFVSYFLIIAIEFSMNKVDKY